MRAREKMRRKNLRIRAGWCKRQGTKRVPNNLTNQYLWDLDCGLNEASTPARKRKGMKGNATRCVNYRLLLQLHECIKKTCASAQVGVIQVVNFIVDTTYQYLWDLQCSKPRFVVTSTQSQQHIAKCNQRFVFSGFCLTFNDMTHISFSPRRKPLEHAIIFRNTGTM